MRVVVVGAGEVGSSIAASLADSHEVVVIDVDAEKVEQLNYSVDALAIEGDGASLPTLQEAGIEDADILIASTDNDETNIITCGTAKTVADLFTIARIKGTNYLETWQGAEGALGVDFMVGTTMLTARSVVRVIGLPAARDVDTFAGGRGNSPNNSRTRRFWNTTGPTESSWNANMSTKSTRSSPRSIGTNGIC